MNEDNWLEMAYEDRTEIYDFNEVVEYEDEDEDESDLFGLKAFGGWLA